MVTLSDRLKRLEIITTPTQPIEIEFHVIEVVSNDNLRRGSWSVTSHTINKTITFYASTSTEFQLLRNQYKAQHKALTLSVDPECIDFTIALPEGPITVTNN